MPVEVINSPDTDPQVNLAREEEVFNKLRADPRPVCLFYINDPCVIMGRANREAEWVNLPAIQADGIPLLRRFTGGGTVYHDRFNLNFSFMVPIKLIEARDVPDTQASRPSRYIDWFRRIIISALSQGGPGYAAAGISDITLNGRKLSGNAQRIARDQILHHGTIMRRCPLNAIERYLRIPPNRQGVDHRGFVTGLAEEGRDHSEAELQDWLLTAFATYITEAEKLAGCY